MCGGGLSFLSRHFGKMSESLVLQNQSEQAFTVPLSRGHAVPVRADGSWLQREQNNAVLRTLHCLGLLAAIRFRE